MFEKSLASPVDLDEQRLARLAAAAARRRTTVAALLQGAVDAALPPVDADRRRTAGRFLLDAPAMPVPADWVALRPGAEEPGP